MSPRSSGEAAGENRVGRGTEMLLGFFLFSLSLSGELWVLHRRWFQDGKVLGQIAGFFFFLMLLFLFAFCF